MVKGIRLTMRGRVVVAVIAITTLLWIDAETTPDECKVPVQEMSQFCIDLIYP